MTEHSEDTRAHYDRLAATYTDDALYVPGSPAHEWMLARVSEELRLRPDMRLLDIGCGRGRFTSDLAALVGLTRPAVGVEASAEYCALASGLTGVEVIHADALAWLEGRAQASCEAALIKGAAHHFLPDGLPALYTRLHRVLSPGGRVLTLTRPKYVDFPIFAAALQVWAQNQIELDEYVETQRESGFTVTVLRHGWTVTLPKRQWLTMIARRFWSTFSHFDDDELRAGIDELEQRFADTEEISFVDPLLFIVGER